MRKDTYLEFSKAQAVTSTGDTNSTNVVNFGIAKNANEDLYLVVQPTETVTSAGAATVAFDLQTSAAEGSGYTTLVKSADFGKADLVKGSFRYAIQIPRGMLQYAKLVFTVGTAALTAGKFDAFLTDEIPGEV